MQEKEPTISLLMPMQPGWTMDYSVEVPVVDADGKPVLRADGTPAIQTETRTKTIKKLEMDRRELIVTQFVFQTVAGKKLGIEEVKTEFAKPRHVIFGAVPHPYYAEVLKDDVIVILQKPPQSRNSQPR